MLLNVGYVKPYTVLALLVCCVCLFYSRRRLSDSSSDDDQLESCKYKCSR